MLPIKHFISLLLLFSAFVVESQAQNRSSDVYYNHVFDARYVQYKPYFPFGNDSAQRFYMNHFSAWDTVISTVINHSDTALYLRIYFSFVVDKSGALLEPHFERIAATPSRNTASAKTLNYFKPLQPLLQKAVANMLHQMPLWKPAAQYGRPVLCKQYEFIQIWIGLQPPL